MVPDSTKLPSGKRSTVESSTATSPATCSTPVSMAPGFITVRSCWLGAEVRACRVVAEERLGPAVPRNSRAKTSSRIAIPSPLPSPLRGEEINLEDDKAAAQLACRERAEGLVGFVETIAMRDELVDAEAAREVQLDEARQVIARARAPIAAAADRALARDDRADVERHGSARGGNADEHAGPTRAERVGRLGHRACVPHRDKREVHSAPCDRLHGGHGILAGGVHAMGRSQRPRMIEARRLHVDGDDRMRGDHVTALHDVETDAARPEHGHARPRGHRRGVDHRAHARHHRAADQGRAIEGHAFVDGDGAGFRHHRARGVGSDVAVVIDALAAERHARGAVGEDAAPRLAALAEVGAADDAEVAAPAGGRPREDHMVPLAEAVGTRAPRLHRPRAPLAQHGRDRPARPASVSGVKTAVTDPARRHADDDLTCPRRLQFQLLGPKWLALLEEHRCAHSGLPRQLAYRMRGSRYRYKRSTARLMTMNMTAMKRIVLWVTG